MNRFVVISILLLEFLATQTAWAYLATDRWTDTATNPNTGTWGTPVTVTWGLIDDGVIISGSEGFSGSDLIDFMETNIDPDPNIWMQVFEDSFGRLGEVSGLTYVYEPNNTSEPINNTTPPEGVLGVLPDVRIGGHSIDGQSGSNTLAYNYFPDHSDMVIDTDNVNSYSNPANNYRLFRNVVMHEALHGLGLSHIESNNAAFLIEPSINTSFDGPQMDDIRALHRLYGDALEKSGGNDTSGTATSLGTITDGLSFMIGQSGDSTVVASTETDFISVDGNSDSDYFSFTLDNELEVTLDLIPRGTTYNQSTGGGPQLPVNSKAISDLTLALINTNGSSVITTANSGGAGESESIVETLDAGTYYARVTGTANDIQLYGLNITGAFFSGQDLIWTGNLGNGWDVDTTPNFDNSGPSTFIETDNVTFPDGGANSVANQTTVDISSTNVTPNDVTFTNLSDTYTLTGTNGIVGNASIAINGGGTVVLANTGNAYSGNTEVSSGSTLVVRNDQSGLAGNFNLFVGSTLQIGDASVAGDLGAAVVDVAAGATLDITDDDGQIEMQISGDGDIEVRETAKFTNDMSGFGGIITQYLGSLDFDGSASGTFKASSTVALAGGGLRVLPMGDVRVLDSALEVAAGTAPNVYVANTGASELILNGPITVSDPDAQFSAVSESTLTLNGNTIVESGVVLELHSEGSGADGIQVNGSFAGEGGLLKSGPGELRFNGSMTHTGNTTIAEGSLILGQLSNPSLSPFIEVQTGTTLDVTPKSIGLFLVNGQTLDLSSLLKGDLTIAFGSTLTIGDSGFGSIDGDYSQNFGATLEIELMDPNMFDFLEVTGDLTAGGTLQISRAGDYVFSAGDSFDILDFSSLFGSFDSVELPDLAAGLEWDVTSLLTTGELSVAGTPGDYNGDQIVDALDFLLWQRTDGTHQGLAAWESNYGGSASQSHSAAVVPEPYSFVLFVLGCILGCLRGKHCRA